MYKYICDESNFYDLALELSESNHKVAYCDIETTGLDCWKDKILTFQIMVGEQIYIFDFLKLNKEHLKYLVDLLMMSKVTTVFQNAKFDMKFLFHNTGTWLTNSFDTMNCEVALRAGVGKSTYSLKYLVEKYLGEELKKDERANFYEEEVTSISENMLVYAARDVKVLETIYTKQLELVKEYELEKIIDIEMRLLAVIADMEHNGVPLNKELWASLDAKEQIRLGIANESLKDAFLDDINLNKYADVYEFTKDIAFPVKTQKLERELRLLTGNDIKREWFKKSINFRSNKQLKACLNLIGIDVESVDKKVIKKLKESPVTLALLERSQATKRIDTYGVVVFDYINPVSGRIHTEFLDIGTATGRLSSGNPINLQNIPTAEGYREGFISSPDFDWLSLDYSQQEFRLCGSVTGEEKIIEAYIAGKDMHIATAGLIYNKPLDEIAKPERFVGKTANFTIIYGGTEWALGRNLGIPTAKSLEILKAFNDGYKTLSKFKTTAEDMIVEMGYSTTPLGRRRWNPVRPQFQTTNEYIMYISKLKREGFNHIIQGGAADITKIAMNSIWYNNPFGDKLRMLIQVHDEINLEAHHSISKEAAQFVKQCMLDAEQPFLGRIPAAVDIAPICDHWVH